MHLQNGTARDVELDTLPVPTIQSPRSKSFSPRGPRPFHSQVAQTIFGVCLTESVLLFSLLMCQGVNVLDPQCVPLVTSFTRRFY